MKGFNKKALQEAGEQFAIAMKNCINSSKWKVTDLAGGETYPCYPDPAPSTTSSDGLKKWKKELKKIIGFTCPEDEKTTCSLYENTTATFSYVCLDIRKKIKEDEKYQVFVHLNTKVPDKCSMYCAKDSVTSFTDLSNTNCVKDPPSFSEKCKWSKSIVTCLE